MPGPLAGTPANIYSNRFHPGRFHQLTHCRKFNSSRSIEHTTCAFNRRREPGAHPRRRHVDLGATITAPEQDKNLGIKTYLNGTLVSDIVLDTSVPATDTIDYVATDTNGLSPTSTRTVIIEPTSPPASTADAATSTSQ